MPAWSSCTQDTGLLYRAVGFKAAKHSIIDEEDKVVQLAQGLSPDDLSDPALRGDDAAKAASKISVGSVPSAVVDGRLI